MPSSTLPTLSADDLDELIYLTRAGDLAELKDQITTLCATHACAPSTLLEAAIDVDTDGEGTGTGCSLLHYPAANGNVEVLSHLLSLLKPSERQSPEELTSTPVSPATTNTNDTNTTNLHPSHIAYPLINHSNTSLNTPLHWASLNGRLDAVKLLVTAGADPWMKNAVGRDSLAEAEVAGENGVDGAKECVVWMLMNSPGVEDMEGRGTSGEAEGDEVADKMNETKSTNGAAAAAANGNGSTKEKQEP